MRPQPKTVNGIPRRARIDLRTPAEKAIMDALREVEEMPVAAPELTAVVNVLHEAFEKLADFNEKPEPVKPPVIDPPNMDARVRALEAKLDVIVELLEGPPDPNANVGASDAPRKEPPPPGLRRRVLDMWNFLEIDYRQSRWPGEGLDHTLMRWREMILDIAKPKAFDDHEFEDIPAPPRESMGGRIGRRVRTAAIRLADYFGISWLSRSDRELMREANSLHTGIFR